MKNPTKFWAFVTLVVINILTCYEVCTVSGPSEYNPILAFGHIAFVVETILLIVGSILLFGRQRIGWAIVMTCLGFLILDSLLAIGVGIWIHGWSEALADTLWNLLCVVLMLLGSWLLTHNRVWPHCLSSKSELDSTIKIVTKVIGNTVLVVVVLMVLASLSASSKRPFYFLLPVMAFFGYKLFKNN